MHFTLPHRRTQFAVHVFALVIGGGVLVSGQGWTMAPAVPDSAVSDFFDRYARGEVVVGPLPAAPSRLEFSQQIRRFGMAWVGPRTAPEAARRRLTVATLVVDIIHENFEAAWREGLLDGLLEWACELLREGPPLAAERTWHLAAIALIEQASAFKLIPTPLMPSGNTVLVSHLLHAERRFPGDGQWILARGVDAEFGAWPPLLGEQILQPPNEVEGKIRDGLRAAFDNPTVAAEAHLRWGYFQLRRGRWADALKELDTVGTPDDIVLRYWLHLFRGRTLIRLKRTGDAIESFRAALRELPGTQAATVALGAALTDQGWREEARLLVDEMLSRRPVADPWVMYGFPAYRHWPASIAALRRAIAP